MEDFEKIFTEFPPVSPEEWWEKIREDLKGKDPSKLYWTTDEGIIHPPFYSQEDLKKLQENSRFYPLAYLIPADKTKNEWEACMTVHPGQENFETADFDYWFNREINTFNLNLTDAYSMDDLINLIPDKLLSRAHFYLVLDSSETRKIWSSESSGKFLKKLCSGGGIMKDVFLPYLSKGQKIESQENFKNEVLQHFDKIYQTGQDIRSFDICGDLIYNAGGNLVHEISVSLAMAIEYLDILTDAGFSLDEIAPRLRFRLATGSNYFGEIAKLRVFRLLWASILKELGCNSPSRLPAYIYSISSTYNKSIYDRHTNLLRNTTEAMASVIGGTDALEILPFDVCFQQADSFSKRIAHNLHLLLKYESHFNEILDPAAGSYFIENYTYALADRCFEYLKEIEKEGGIIAYFNNGKLTEDIRQSFESKRDKVRKGKIKVLGTNSFPLIQEKIRQEVAHEKIKELENYPLPDGLAIQPQRKALDFELLRLKTEKASEKQKKPPLVMLVPFGKPATATARQIFALNFMGVAGFDVIENENFKIPDKALQAILQKQPDIIVFCSSDEEYEDFIKTILPEIKKNLPHCIAVVAGPPQESLKLLNIQDFIHSKSDMYQVLTDFQNRLKL